MKNIAVVGSGLNGCLTAFKIAKKFSKYNVYLIDNSDDILPSLKSIKLKDINLNNGFHALDIERCENLYIFLKKNLKIKFTLIKNTRHVMINNFFFKENISVENYPFILQNKNNNKKIISGDIKFLYNSLPNKLKSIIKKTSQRYSNNFQDNLKFFIPWFLPSNYLLKSKDEGDLFRNLIKTGNMKNLLAVPKNKLFETLRFKFKKSLKELKNIKIILNTKILINKKKITLSLNKEIDNVNFDHTFICTNSISLIDHKKKLYKNLLRDPRFLISCLISSESKTRLNITETICLNTNFIEFSRISIVATKGNKKYYLIEFITNDQNSFQKKINQNNLKMVLKNYFLDKAKSLKIIDYKTTRKMFFPINSIIKQAINEVKKIVKDNSLKNNKIHCNINFGPINMTKAWVASEKNLTKIK